MKKLLCILMAVTMMLAMAVPAAAAEDDINPPSYSTWQENWVKNNPELVEEMLKDEPPLWAEYGYDSLEEMLAEWDITEEEYYYDFVLYDRLWEYYSEEWDDFYEREYANWVAETRVAMGGTREGLAVMVNNRYIQFPDAQPEITDSRTMIPLRALMEALGATVDFANEGSVVSADLNGTHFEFSVGTSEISVTRGGVTEVVAMDCNTYIKDGRTYVPVRFFSEAAGYGVVWDADFQTAVIIDRTAVVNEIDKDFTILNKLFEAPAATIGESFRQTLDMSATITSFSSLDGDKTMKVSVKMTVISNGKAYNATVTYDLRGLVDMLFSDLDFDAEELAQLLAIANGSIEMIVDTDSDCVYIKFPAMTEELGLGRNTWILVEDAGLDALDDIIELETMMAASNSIASVGAALYESEIYYAEYYYGVFTYDSILAEGKAMAGYMGDSCFTKSGNSYTISFDRDDYEMMEYGQLPVEGSYYDYDVFDVKLTVTEGANGVSISGSFDIREKPWYYSTSTAMSGTFSVSPLKISANISVHVENSFKADITLSSTTTVGAQNPATRPPAGSNIVNYNDVY